MTDTSHRRFAVVRNARTRREADAYLPGAYRVVAELPDTEFGHPVFVIAGRDVAGWTLDGYVIPRYQSGLIWAEEIEADDARIPADVHVRDEGYLVLLTLNDEALEWWEDNVEDGETFASAKVVEHRYADDVITGLTTAGFKVEAAS